MYYFIVPVLCMHTLCIAVAHHPVTHSPIKKSKAKEAKQYYKPCVSNLLSYLFSTMKNKKNFLFVQTCKWYTSIKFNYTIYTLLCIMRIYKDKDNRNSDMNCIIL